MSLKCPLWLYSALNFIGFPSFLYLLCPLGYVISCTIRCRSRGTGAFKFSFFSFFSQETFSDSETILPEIYSTKFFNSSVINVLFLSYVLPRGLIDSGNLCFLNSTLQALLSCSPFILLLQGLRNRNFPKVDYPTLIAFAEFIAEFEFPGGTNIKKKDTDVLETGRAFSPFMFEAVLKIFSTDVPSSISGRPRLYQ